MIDPGDARASAHAFVASLDAPVLTSDDHHHLARVLRLASGELITVSDGEGKWRLCALGAIGGVSARGPRRGGDAAVAPRPAAASNTVALEPTSPIHEAPRLAPSITIAFALVPGNRPEWITQKLTELGVDRIVPFAAQRSVVRWDERRAARHHERLQRVAREAAMQCRRCWLPDVTPTTSFEAVAALPGATLAERNGAPLAPNTHTLLIGPEGGWSPVERELGLPTTGLGDHVLRAETAAVAAACLVTALRSGRVAPF